MENGSGNAGSLILGIEVDENGALSNQTIAQSSEASGKELSLGSGSIMDGAFSGADISTDMSAHVVTASADGARVLLANGTTETVPDGTAVSATVSGHFVADAVTLRSLLATGAVQLTDATGQPLEISGDSAQVFSMLNQPSTSAVEAEPSCSKQDLDGDDIADMLSITAVPQITLPPLPTTVPAGTPAWAARLRDCEKIGDYYRGWVENDIELDLLLTYHKQQTRSTWGTRQSPCPAKQTTRLMWRSQYAPFDGIPFLNAGSRAIVMECQFGPRRKGIVSKKEMGPLNENFKKTCPARIYVKKVKKFVEYAVEIVSDKKAMKAEMDRAFELLKKNNFRAFYQERYYVQLPTIKAHENHAMLGSQDATQPVKLSAVAPVIRDESTPCRLHPLVQNKIRSLVANGETRLYAIRKQLRKYVEKDLFEQADNVPERHNLTYFPTVNDLQNHIHQAVVDINEGKFIFDEGQVELEIVSDESSVRSALLPDRSAAQAEIVTVTLYRTAAQGEEGHIVTKVETQLSDGTTRVSDTLSSETARLLAKLHPNMFPLESLLQRVTIREGQQTSVKLQVPTASAESQLLAAEATSADRSSAPAQLMDLHSDRDTETIDLATAAELVSTPEADKSPQKESDNSSQHLAKVIAASSDQSGYALVQTETGALLLAKGSPAGGYHVLGQAGATISAEFAQSSPAPSIQRGNTDGSFLLVNPTDQSQVVTDFPSIPPSASLQLGTALPATDSASVVNISNIFQNIKTEVDCSDPGL